MKLAESFPYNCHRCLPIPTLLSTDGTYFKKYYQLSPQTLQELRVVFPQLWAEIEQDRIDYLIENMKAVASQVLMLGVSILGI